MHTSIDMIYISYCSVGFRTWSQGTPRDIRITPKYGASRLQTTKYGQFRNDVWYNMFPQKKSNKLSLLWFLHICFFLFLSSSLSSLAYLRDLQIPTRKKNKPGLHIPRTIWCSMICSIGHPSDRSYHLFTKCTLNILQWQSELRTISMNLQQRPSHKFLFAVIQFNLSMLPAGRRSHPKQAFSNSVLAYWRVCSEQLFSIADSFHN